MNIRIMIIFDIVYRHIYDDCISQLNVYYVSSSAQQYSGLSNMKRMLYMERSVNVNEPHI